MSTSKDANTYNRHNWKESKFPLLCQTCLVDNHYIRMKKEKHQKECKTCKESFIVSRWCPGARMRLKKTEVCQTCSQKKIICQSCLKELEIFPDAKSDDRLLRQYHDTPKLEPPEDKTITTLYVGGLGEKVHSDDLMDCFHQFGEIRSINMMHKQQCAFVQFKYRSSAEFAAENSSNRLIIKGQRLSIQWSRPPGQQQSTKKGENEEEEMVQSTQAVTMPPQDNGQWTTTMMPTTMMTAPFLGRGGPGPLSGIKMECPSQNPYSGEMGKVSNARVQSRYPDQNRKRRLRFKLYSKHKHNTKLKYPSQNPCSGEMGKFSNARVQSRYPDQNRKRRHMFKLYSTRFMYRRHSTRLKYLSQNPNRNMSEFVFNSEVMIKKKKKKNTTVKYEIHVTNVDVLQCGQNNTLVYNKISSATDDERQRVDNSTITIYYGKKAKVYSCPKSAAVFVIFGDHCMIDVHELKELAETTEEEDMSDSDDEWENS